MLLGGVITEAVDRYIIVLTTLALLQDFTADSEDFFFLCKALYSCCRLTAGFFLYITIRVAGVFPVIRNPLISFEFFQF